MMDTLQYDPRKRPTASELLKHPFFTNYSISKDVYAYAKGKKLKKFEALKSNEVESLKISPNGITIEKEAVDNSPFKLDRYKDATGMISGFDLRKAEKHLPKIVQKPNYNEIEPSNELVRQPSILDQELIKKSVLLKNSEDYKQPYIRVEEKMDLNEFKSRMRDPIYPYYQTNNDVLNGLKMQPVLVEDRDVYNKEFKYKDKPFPVVQKSNYDLAQPALITSNYKDKKLKKYELDFSNKNRHSDNLYNPMDSYQRKVLNVQQSLPELNTYKIKQAELERYATCFSKTLSV